MARELIQDGESLNNYSREAFEQRKEELEMIEQIAQDILDNKDKLYSLVVGMESEGKTYRAWVGSMNGCYGLTRRIGLNIEAQMGEFYNEE